VEMTQSIRNSLSQATIFVKFGKECRKVVQQERVWRKSFHEQSHFPKRRK